MKKLLMKSNWFCAEISYWGAKVTVIKETFLPVNLGSHLPNYLNIIYAS